MLQSTCRESTNCRQSKRDALLKEESTSLSEPYRCGAFLVAKKTLKTCTVTTWASCSKWGESNTQSIQIDICSVPAGLRSSASVLPSGVDLALSTISLWCRITAMRAWMFIWSFTKLTQTKNLLYTWPMTGNGCNRDRQSDVQYSRTTLYALFLRVWTTVDILSTTTFCTFERQTILTNSSYLLFGSLDSEHSAFCIAFKAKVKVAISICFGSAFHCSSILMHV